MNSSEKCFSKPLADAKYISNTIPLTTVVIISKALSFSLCLALKIMLTIKAPAVSKGSVIPHIIRNVAPNPIYIPLRNGQSREKMIQKSKCKKNTIIDTGNFFFICSPPLSKFKLI